MFVVIENKTTGKFEILYAGRVILTFPTKDQADARADKLNGKAVPASTPGTPA